MDSLYLELNNTLDNIKYIELKIKKCEILMDGLSSCKPHFFERKKYLEYKNKLSEIKNEYSYNYSLFNKELVNLEVILSKLH